MRAESFEKNEIRGVHRDPVGASVEVKAPQGLSASDERNRESVDLSAARCRAVDNPPRHRAMSASSFLDQRFLLRVDARHRQFDAFDPAGLRRTLEAVAALAREYDVRFADLHAIFPDDHFRDPAGHFTTKHPDAPRKLAEALADHVLDDVPRLSVRAIGSGD